MNGGGFALPRLRVRSRRRKPRGPWWRYTAAFCCVWLVLIAVNLLVGNPWSAAGAAIFFTVDWRDLHRAPCDPEARPLTIREEAHGVGLCMLGLALCVVGIAT